MTKTTNYQLPQWEAADPIRRTDFNAAMSALDAGVAAAQTTADTARTEAAAAQNTAQEAASAADAAAALAAAEKLRVDFVSVTVKASGPSTFAIPAGAKLGLFWSYPASPVILSPSGNIGRLYFADWDHHWTLSMSSSSVQVESDNDSSTRTIQYALFY